MKGMKEGITTAAISLYLNIYKRQMYMVYVFMSLPTYMLYTLSKLQSKSKSELELESESCIVITENNGMH